MKRVKFLSTVFSIALLSLTACSNDDNKTTDEGQVSAVQAIEFKVDFADYNAEQEVGVTRANKEVKLEQQMVDLGNGILAQCSLQRDTTKQTKSASTRALANDTYTMLAYDAATHAYKGDITGTVTGGVFTATSANQDISLAPGTYDFVLYNSKVTRSGNNLIVNRADADAALIGRTQQVITATPHKQKVPFTMKHVGAKVKIKLTGYMDIPAVTATLASVNATDVPGSSIYDASTGTWTAGTGAAMSANTTFNASSELYFFSNTFTSKSNEETMFMPATDVSKLKLTFNSGNIYLVNMANAGLTFKPASTLKLEQNGAYVLNVKLMYNYLYLMSDGTTGFINETTYGGGTKTPIAVVVSQSQRLAIALKDAGNGGAYIWQQYPLAVSNVHIQFNLSDALNSDITSGKDETWNASYSTNNFTGSKVKAENPLFPAFNVAAAYNPGVPLTGANLSKWFLPSAMDWWYAFRGLGFCSNTKPTQHGGGDKWFGTLASIAFTQVGGTTINGADFTAGGNRFYWTSSEYYYDDAFAIRTYNKQYSYGGNHNDFKYRYYHVRSFITY